MKISSIFYLLMITFSSCRKERAPFDLNSNISFSISTVDSSNNITSSFSPGYNVEFEVKMENIGQNSISYYGGIRCGEMKLRVYKDNVFFGFPYSENLACPENLVLEEINPGQVKLVKVKWFDRSGNPSLTSGNYSVIFESTISIDEIEDSFSIRTEKQFIIQ